MDKKQRREQAARAIFFISGFGTASWAPLVPVLKERMALDENVLGMLLLCIGFGSLITMALSGAAAARFGCKRVLTCSAVIFAALLVIICKISNFELLVLALIMFGAIMGCTDVVQNLQAVIVEKNSGRRLMSGMHALWSIGGFCGAGLFGVWVGLLGFSPFMSTVIAAMIMLAILIKFREDFLDSGGERGGTLIAIPRGIVIFVGLIAMISFLVEGAIKDWSGVFLTTAKGFDISMAGTGFTAFSAAMLTMRLIGDGLVQVVGQKVIVLGGLALAFAGFILTITATSNFILYAGFFLIGMGSANIVPVFFSLLGKQKVMPINMAVPAVSTMAYLGVLMGPALIGFFAHQTSLFAAFGGLATLVAAQMFIAAYIYRKIL